MIDFDILETVIEDFSQGHWSEEGGLFGCEPRCLDEYEVWEAVETYVLWEWSISTNDSRFGELFQEVKIPRNRLDLSQFTANEIVGLISPQSC